MGYILIKILVGGKILVENIRVPFRSVNKMNNMDRCKTDSGFKRVWSSTVEYILRVSYDYFYKSMR